MFTYSISKDKKEPFPENINLLGVKLCMHTLKANYPMWERTVLF